MISRVTSQILWRRSMLCRSTLRKMYSVRGVSLQRQKRRRRLSNTALRAICVDPGCVRALETHVCVAGKWNPASADPCRVLTYIITVEWGSKTVGCILGQFSSDRSLVFAPVGLHRNSSLWRHIRARARIYPECEHKLRLQATTRSGGYHSIGNTRHDHANCNDIPHA